MSSDKIDFKKYFESKIDDCTTISSLNDMRDLVNGSQELEHHERVDLLSRIDFSRHIVHEHEMQSEWRKQEEEGEEF